MAVALSLPLAAQDSAVAQGFDHFYNLEYDQAIADFQRAIAQDPNSPDLHNHLAQTLVFREMYRDGALESELVSGNNSFLRRPKLNPTPEIEREFLDEVARAMALCEARLKTNPNDTALMSVTLGSQAVNQVKTALHGRPLFEGEAGLLGNELLSRFTVTVDWPNRQVVLAEPSK